MSGEMSFHSLVKVVMKMYLVNAIAVVTMCAGVAAQQAGETSPQGRPGQSQPDRQNMPKVTVTGCLQNDTASMTTGSTATGGATTARGETAGATAAQSGPMFKLTNASMTAGGRSASSGRVGTAGTTSGGATGTQTAQTGQAGQMGTSGMGQTSARTATEYRVTVAPDATIDLAAHINHQVELEGMLRGEGRRGGPATGAATSTTSTSTTTGNTTGSTTGYPTGNNTSTQTAQAGQVAGGRDMNMTPTLQVTNLKMIARYMSGTVSR